MQRLIVGALVLVCLALSAQAQIKPYTISVEVSGADGITRAPFEAALNREFRRLDGVALVSSDPHVKVNIVLVEVIKEGEMIGLAASFTAALPLGRTIIDGAVKDEKNAAVKRVLTETLSNFEWPQYHAIVVMGADNAAGIAEHIAATVDSKVIELLRRAK